jgi:hypothetical protein
LALFLYPDTSYKGDLMAFLKSIGLCFLLLIFVACGGGGTVAGPADGGGIKRLDGTQKTSFEDTMGSMAIAFSATRESQEVLGKKYGLPEDPVKKEKMKSKMKGNCTITQVIPEPGDQVPREEISSLSATGPACPINLDFRSRMYVAQTYIDANMAAKYDVKDEEFKKINDVYGLSFAAKIYVTFGAGHVSGSGSGSGEILSQRFGTIAIGQNFTISSRGTTQQDYFIDSVEITTFRFTDFVVVLRGTSSGSQGKTETHYYLNDEEISAEEYHGYMGGIGAQQSRSHDNKPDLSFRFW